MKFCHRFNQGERARRLGGLCSYLQGQRGVAIVEQGTALSQLVYQIATWLSQPAYESPGFRAEQDLVSVCMHITEARQPHRRDVPGMADYSFGPPAEANAVQRETSSCFRTATEAAV